MSGVSRWRSSTFSAIGFASSHILSRGTSWERTRRGAYRLRFLLSTEERALGPLFTAPNSSVLTAADERPLHVVATSTGAGGLLRQWRDPGRGAVANGCADPRITGKTALRSRSAWGTEWYGQSCEARPSSPSGLPVW